MSRFINPYNFSPLPAAVPRQPVETAPGWARLAPDCYSGYLQADIITLTRLFIPSRRKMDLELDFTTDKHQKQEHPVYKKYLYGSANRKMIPGTSVKGSIRSVIEALSDSCLGLFGGSYKQDRADKKRLLDYRNKAPGETVPGRCRLRAEAGGPVTDPADGLCVCCRLFGLASGGGAEPEAGNYTAFQGRVAFDDFFLAESSHDKISKNSTTLPELSDPKPWHSPFYLDGNGAILGRKFYLHHDPSGLHTAQKTKRNCTIRESILAGARFTGRIRFTNLSAQEMGLLFWGLELDDRLPFDAQASRAPDLLAHKLGMGKPLGLGSVKIRVAEMMLIQPAARYAAFAWPEKEQACLETPLSGERLRDTVRELKEAWAMDAFEHRDQLRTLLTFPTSRAMVVCYPTHAWFPCSHIGLPSDGVLPDSCPPPTATPSPKAASSGSSRPFIKVQAGIVKAGKGKQQKAGPKEVIVQVVEVMGNKAKAEAEGESLLVTGINPYLGVKAKDSIKIRLTRLPDGRIKAEFKSIVKS